MTIRKHSRFSIRAKGVDAPEALFRNSIRKPDTRKGVSTFSRNSIRHPDLRNGIRISKV
jgi:hypothetical protein